MTTVPRVFDRALVARRRERALAAGGDGALVPEMAERLLDRLDDVRRSFPEAVELDARPDTLRPRLAGHRVQRLTACAATPAVAAACGAPAVTADAEALPFAPRSADLVLSCLALHWVNDLPGVLAQARRVLRPDGLFLSVQWGEATLRELRACLLAAEAEVAGGVRRRVAPLVDVATGGALLQRAGFVEPVADTETLTVRYADPWALVADLRTMGDTAALAERTNAPPPRRLFERAMTLYRERYGGADGRVPATFQPLYLTGWV